MNIVIVSHLVEPSKGKPFLVPPEAPTFGFSGYSFLYPDHPTYHIQPGDLRKHLKTHEVDVVFFNPMSVIEPIREMIDLARSIAGLPSAPIFLSLDCDVSSHWLLYHPVITQAYLDLFAAVDFVACRTDYATRVTQELVDTPVFWMPEPSTAITDLADWQRAGAAKRDLIVTPTALCSAYNTQRNAMVNHAVCKAMAREYPQYRYVSLSRYDPAIYSHTLGEAKETDILSRIQHKAEVWTGFTHLDIYDMFRRTKLMVNMDHEPSMGHWQLDSAAFGVPTLCTEFTSGGRQLFPTTRLFAYGLEDALSHARRLLSDQAHWDVESARAQEACSFFHADNIRQMFEEGMGIG